MIYRWTHVLSTPRFPILLLLFSLKMGENPETFICSFYSAHFEPLLESFVFLHLARVIARYLSDCVRMLSQSMVKHRYRDPFFSDSRHAPSTKLAFVFTRLLSSRLSMIKYERIWELLLIFFFFLDAEDNFHILDISFSISGKKKYGSEYAIRN